LTGKKISSNLNFKANNIPVLLGELLYCYLIHQARQEL
jgi:hypothetical protein